MNIPKFSLAHKSIVLMILLLVMVIGVFNYFNISQREDPQFKINVALVVSIWPGASADKVERLVTKTLEEKFEEIGTVIKITSTTRENLSVILVRTEYESNIDIGWQKLRNKITEALPDLPESIIGPDVIDDFGDVTAMIYSLSSKTASPAELKTWSKRLRTRIREVDSVGKVELLGEQDEVIYIEGPLDSFTTYKFAPLTAAKLLDYQNTNLPAGYVRTPSHNYRLEVSGSFKLDEQLGNAILDVSQKSGAPLKVKDVFTVRRAQQEPPLDFMLTDGDVSVGLDIRMKKGENLVVMGEKVKKIADEFAKNLPPNIKLNLVHDQPRQVATFISEFMNNLFEGLAIVCVIMLLAMGLRAAGMIAMTLPLSIILTFALMPLFRVDLESVSIAAFIIALGMLVDNSIIITDNIDVHMRKGETPYAAAWKGTQELIIPALSGTLATVFAFMPLLLMSESSGDYIRSLPIVVSISLAASLVLAVTITPIASAWFMRPKNSSNNANGNEETRSVQTYKSIIVTCLRHRVLVVIATIIAFVGTFFLLPVVGFSFFPEADRDQFLIDIWLPEGSSLDHTENIVRQVGEILDSKEDVASWVSYVGTGGPRFYITIKPEFNANNYANIVVTTKDPVKTRPMVKRLNHEFMQKIAGARVIVSNLFMGTPVEAPIAIRITGPDLKVMKKLSHKIQGFMESIPGTIHVRDNVGGEVPSFKVEVDSEAAAMAGITNTDVALSLLTAYEGLPVTKLREGEDQIQVYMRLIEEERNRDNTVETITVTSQVTGGKVPLPAFADIVPTWGTGVIKRTNTLRSVTALSDVEGRLASDVMTDLKPMLHEIKLPQGYRLEITGEEEERNESFGELLAIFGLIIALILLMLVIQFNSLKKALVILISVPLAIIGAVIGLLVSGNSFAFMPFLGVISLAGMVIKNAVVWVEFVEKHLQQGNRLAQSVVEAGSQRLRPIMLTAGTTIGGLIPLAIFGGTLWEGMAFAMIFGLALSTLLTLVVVPIIYYSVFGSGKPDLSQYKKQS